MKTTYLQFLEGMHFVCTFPTLSLVGLFHLISSHNILLKVKVKVSHSLKAVGAVEGRVPLYLGHS